MRKEKTMAVIVGLIMISSVAGFAFSSASYTGSATANPSLEGGQRITNIMNRSLTSQEISLILRSGGIIIENFYPPFCEECAEGNAILRSFTQKFSNFVVLVEVPLPSESAASESEQEEERLRLLSGSGAVHELDRGNISEDILLDVFCSVAKIQPSECILRQI